MFEFNLLSRGSQGSGRSDYKGDMGISRAQGFLGCYLNGGESNRILVGWLNPGLGCSFCSGNKTVLFLFL